MRRGHGQLFRTKFEPIAQMGDIVVLRNGDTLVSDDATNPFYEVTHVESSPAMGLHGVLVVWCATDTPGAPYTADVKSLVGQNLGVTIPQGGALRPFAPGALQLYPRQVMQFRTVVVSVPDANGAFIPGVLQDFDVRWGSPSAQLRGGTDYFPGVMNAMMQSDIPSMIGAAPAQGSNFPGSTTNPQEDPFELAARSELFQYADNSRSINIQNNGAAAATTGAIGLIISAHVFNLSPVDPTGATPKQFLGNPGIPVPADVNLADVIAMPVSAQSIPRGTTGGA